MTRSQALSHQTAFRLFARTDHWQLPHAVTLTMRQAVGFTNGSQSTLVRIEQDAASQNFRHFMNLLNRRVLGKPAERYGARLRVIPVQEGCSEKRLHYHAMIDCPHTEVAAAFPYIIDETWQATEWGFRQTDIQPDANAGWIDYISKFRDKPSYADAVDWSNYHNPD